MLGVFWVVCKPPIFSDEICYIFSVKWWPKKAGIDKLINGNTGSESTDKGAFSCHTASSGVQPGLTLPVASHVLLMLLYFTFSALTRHIFSSFAHCWFVFQSFYFLAFTLRWMRNAWEMDSHGSNFKAPPEILSVPFPPLIRNQALNSDISDLTVFRKVCDASVPSQGCLNFLTEPRVHSNCSNFSIMRADASQKI